MCTEQERELRQPYHCHENGTLHHRCQRAPACKVDCGCSMVNHRDAAKTPDTQHSDDVSQPTLSLTFIGLFSFISFSYN